MSLIVAWFQLVTGDASVSALIGTRFHPVIIPQDETLPAAAYQILSDVPQVAHESDGTDGIRKATVQMSYVSDTYTELHTLTRTVETAVVGKHAAANGIRMDSVIKLNEVDGFNDSTDRHTVRQDYEIVYMEVS